MILIRLCAVAILSTTLLGCAATNTNVKKQTDTKPDISSWQAEQYYAEARKAQTSGDYKSSLTYFSEMEIRYPLSPFSQLAPLEIAYAHYKTEEYELANQEADRFMEFYPKHENRDYALYLKGLSTTKLAHRYRQENSPDNTKLWLQNQRSAYSQFSELSNRYPNSQYSPDATKRMAHLRNEMAQYELDIAKQLLEENKQDVALKRVKYISDNYHGTPAASEAVSLFANPAPSETFINGADSKIVSRDENWLLAQNPEYFTVQIAGTSQRLWMDDFVVKNKLQDKAAYYRRQHMGKQWYSILHGSYENRADAEQTAQQLLENLPIADAWVRQYKSIQSTLQSP